MESTQNPLTTERNKQQTNNSRVAKKPSRDTTQASSDVEHALMLLLRSPRLSLSTIMELLEIGDSEFRRLSGNNAQVARLLQARREGTLTQRAKSDVQRCAGCGETYVPYAGRRVCSDTCAKICQIQGRAKC